jgi:signal transduction histidine kinase
MRTRLPSAAITPVRATSRLRTQLFAGSAILSSAILIIAAWVINTQVVKQARQQVQEEVQTLMPLYDAVWNEIGERLSTLGATMANSPIVKTIIGDQRASEDQATLREMLSDFREVAATPVDLFLITDGSGRIRFAEIEGESIGIDVLPAASESAERQEQLRGFIIISGRLFQTTLTPVLLHSGNVGYENTLAVLGAGTEIDRETVSGIRERMHSQLMFFVGDRALVSSFPPALEEQAAQAVAQNTFDAQPESPREIDIDGQTFLAFSRDLPGFRKERIGRVVVLRSLAGAKHLFSAISNRLLLLWTLSVGLALLLSYLVANRITRPVEALVSSVNEFGAGNYDCEVPTGARGEIGMLARAFDGMRSSLRQSQSALLRSERLATIGRMASSVVHDLRNPLATITTAAEVLGRDGLPIDRRQVLLESQLRASERMNAMLSEMLEYSRGAYRLNLQRCRIADIVDAAIGQVRAAAEREGVSVESRVERNLEILGDFERLRRVIENLLSNAVQAEPRGGVVSVRASVVEDGGEENHAHVRIDIIDHGAGVPPELRDRIFEPFVTYGKAGGTGLGLAIVQGVINAHKGSVGCEDLGDGGSVFFVILPLAGREESDTE